VAISSAQIGTWLSNNSSAGARDRVIPADSPISPIAPAIIAVQVDLACAP